MPKFYNKHLLRVHTRYLTDNQNWNSKIPKARVGDKKYIGIIHGNKHLMEICDVHPEEFLKLFGRELVPRHSGTAKYNGEKTTYQTILKTHSEFRTITSVFNKRYGHGNWRFIAPKRLQYILQQIEPVPNTTSSLTFTFGTSDRNFYLKKYPGGVNITIVVNAPDADIAKQLFKVVLKG